MKHHEHPSCVWRFLGKLNPTWRQVLRLDPCSYCGQVGGTVDHIVPTAAGGSNGIENLTGACPDCNVQKKHQGMLQFMLSNSEETK